MHEAGVALALAIAVYGAGFSIGRHVIKTMRGNIRGSVAIAHVMRDVVICFVVGYVGGAIFTGATTATNSRVNVDFGLNAMTGNSADALTGTASELSGAANNLIDKVTNGAFRAMSSAGNSVGSTLTNFAAGTAFSGVVGSIVGTLGTIGTFLGAATASTASALIFGAVLGIFYALIFDR